MDIQRFEVPGLAQYAYLIASHGEAALIDPIRDIDGYLAALNARGLTLRYVLETHIHADYASGAPALAAATGATLALSSYDRGERFVARMPHHPLADGDTLAFGSVRLQALHTPGHTPEHLSFLLFDLDRSETIPSALFSGDFLFVGSVGRPDLLGEDAKLALAQQLYTSLHTRIAALPDSLQLFPGHGAGSLCGAGLSERPDSTLGYERATQSLFHLDQPAFLDALLGSLPATPKYYPRMKELNSDGALPVDPLPGGRSFSVAEVDALRTEPQTVLLDLRRPEAFGGAHIPGAINIGAGQNLSLWAGWLLDPEDDILLIADSGDSPDLEQARRSLVRVGLDRIAGFLAGGMPAWIASGRTFASLPQVAADDAQATSRHVLDVRSNAEWTSGHIAGATHIPLGDLPTRTAELPRSEPLLVVCGSGYRSSIAASYLRNHGFEDVASLNGGMSAWKTQSLPQV